MYAEIYFAQRRASERAGLLDKLEQLLMVAGLGTMAGPGEQVAILTHFGEPGNTTCLRPAYVHRVAQRLSLLQAEPFVTDSNARTSPTRQRGARHLAAAAQHGFTPEALGVPVRIADGADGDDVERLGGLELAGGLARAEAIVVVQHVTFHPVAGFAGALHHLGTSARSRASKLELAAVAAGGGGAPEAPHAGTLAALAALGRARPGRQLYCNVLTDLTPDPDGVGWSDAPVLPDVGLVVGRDPVAVDQATADLLRTQAPLPLTRLAEVHGPDPMRALHPDSDWEGLLVTAARQGLGRREHELMII